MITLGTYHMKALGMNSLECKFYEEDKQWWIRMNKDGAIKINEGKSIYPFFVT